MNGGRQRGNQSLRRARKALSLVRVRRYRRALRQGVAATIEHSEVPFDAGTRTVIDVGAHKGQFAIFALETFHEARVICFEPLAAPRSVLAQVTSAEQHRMVVLATAADSSPGTRELHVSQLDDSSSLRAIKPRYVRAFPGTEESRLEAVRTEPIALVLGPNLDRPSLLKVDVQGHELDVLEGAEDLLPEIDQILVECSFVELYEGQALAGEVVAYLHDRSFSLAGVFGLKRDRGGHCLQADFFFARKRGLGP